MLELFGVIAQQPSKSPNSRRVSHIAPARGRSWHRTPPPRPATASTRSEPGLALRPARRFCSALRTMRIWAENCSSRQIPNLRRFHGDRTAAPPVHAANCALSRSHLRGRRSGLQLSINFPSPPSADLRAPKLAVCNHIAARRSETYGRASQPQDKYFSPACEAQTISPFRFPSLAGAACQAQMDLLIDSR